MSTGTAVTAAGAGLTGAGGVVAAALGSPWPVLGVLAVAVPALLVLGVVVLTAARTTDEVRHQHAHTVLCTLVFAVRGAVPGAGDESRSPAASALPAARARSDQEQPP